MLSKKKISLIIPCKNEEAAIYSMLNKVPSYIDEVIVIDNNSSDNTTTVAKKQGAKVIIEKRNVDGIGYGYAHQTGMKHATGDIIIAMDGDDTYPIQAIKKIVVYMEKSKSDFVSCSRFPLSTQTAISPIRQLGITILNLEVGLLYGFPIRDILSGMWAMTKETAKKLDVKSGGWDFSPEIKLEAIATPNIHFSEYHIYHAERLNGMSKQQIWKTGFDHLMYILKRRFFDGLDSKKQVWLFGNSLRFMFKSLVGIFVIKAHT